MDKIDAVSSLMLQMEKASPNDDLSLEIEQVQAALDECLADARKNVFGDAVLLQFAFLDLIKNRIGVDAHKAKTIEKVAAIWKKTEATPKKHGDLRAYLDDVKLRVLEIR